ncbi:Probable O-methyltransferase 3 [Linum perenne]
MEGLLSNMSSGELLEAQAHCWNYSFNYIVTMSLRCAVELRIQDAIHRHGPMSLTTLVSTLPLHHSKTDALRRLLRLLIQAGFFTTTVVQRRESEEEHYNLTAATRLLLNGGDGLLTPNLFLMTEPKTMTTWGMLSMWFQLSDDPVPYEAGNDGVSFWECLEKDPEQKKVFLDAMAGDSEVVASVLVSDKELFRGVGKIVDVGGGTGVTAAAIAKAYPVVKCVVFDLPQIVENLKMEEVGNLAVVGGDMFEDPIPAADVVLLKWILHDWDDERCVKILKRCREAVLPSNSEGKVMIIDMVVDTKELSQVQLCFDMLMLATFNGKERSEDEWKSLFDAAGFSGYKIVRSLGARSVIEAYP